MSCGGVGGVEVFGWRLQRSLLTVMGKCNACRDYYEEVLAPFFSTFVSEAATPRPCVGFHDSLQKLLVLCVD